MEQIRALKGCSVSQGCPQGGFLEEGRWRLGLSRSTRGQSRGKVQEEGRAWAPFHKRGVRSRFQEEPIQAAGSTDKSPGGPEGRGMEGVDGFERPGKAGGVAAEDAGPTVAMRDAQGFQGEHFTGQEPGSSPQLHSTLQAHRHGQMNPKWGLRGSGSWDHRFPRGPVVGLEQGQSTCFVTRPQPTPGCVQLCR